MKKIFIALTIGFFLFITPIYGGICSDAWNAIQDEIISEYNLALAACGNPWNNPGWDACQTSAQRVHGVSSALNNIAWTACCYSAPLNC